MRYLVGMVTIVVCFGSNLVMANTNPNQAPPPTPPTVPKILPGHSLLAQGARDAFNRGQRLFAAGDHAGALEAWQDAYRLGDHYEVLYYIAQAYRGLGQYKAAWRTLRHYRDRAPTPEEQKDAIKEMHRLEACTVDVTDPGEVSLHASVPSIESGELHHRLEIRNPTANELEVTEVRSHELEERGIEARYVGSRVIPPFTTLYGYVRYPFRGTQGLELIAITATLDNGMRAPFSIQTSVSPMIMILPDERVKHLTVSLRGVYGAFFAGTGRDGSTINAITDMRGIAVGMQKGMSELLVVEGDFTYAETGNATFVNQDIDGMTGDLSRRAKVARLLGSGALRTGKENILSARMSFGLQLASYDSSLSTSTGVVDVPGSGVSFDGLVGGGIGYMRRLGAHWSLGLSGSFNVSLTSEAKAIEAGMHLSYGWNP